MKIYLDHAATTLVKKEVYEAMKPYFSEKYGNPSSIYEVGQEAKIALEEAREKAAKLIGANPEEIVFTSGATESNNLAIKGIAFYWQKSMGQKNIILTSNKMRGKNLRDSSSRTPQNDNEGKPHIITSSIEHHSVLDTVKYLEDNFGFEATYLPVSKNGFVDPDDVKKAIKDNTVLISIMHANNEVGTIQPISAVAEIIRKAKSKRLKTENQLPLLFLADAVQSFQYLDTDVDKLGVDMLSLTGHKFYGPKGVGLLYVRKGTKFLPQQQGGGQERKKRAGTENVPCIIGMAVAMEIAKKKRLEVVPPILGLRNKLIDGILNNIPNVILAGSKDKRLPNNAAFMFKNVEGESVLINLDMAGIAASSGSACTSGSLEPSHVLTAMGYDHATAHGSIRFTLGESTTEKDIDTVIKKLPKIIEDLRKMSPLK